MLPHFAFPRCLCCLNKQNIFCYSEEIWPSEYTLASREDSLHRMGALFKTYNSSGNLLILNHGNWDQTWLNSKGITNIVPAYCLVTIYFEVMIWISSFFHHKTDPNDSSKYHFYSVKNINSSSPWICNSSRWRFFSNWYWLLSL